MELDELKKAWGQHEKMLLKNTVLNRELLLKVLKQNSEKRIDWLKIRSLAGLLLPFILLVFVVLPRIQFTLELKSIIGFILFLPVYIISYTWAIKLYIYIESVNPNSPLTTVSKQLKLVQKYRLKTTRNNYILLPFMVVGIFLSAGIPFLSSKMIPFYVLMVISFLIGYYVRSKYGLIAQLRKIEKEIAEIAKLEQDNELAA
jgi:biotin transporter BioY